MSRETLKSFLNLKGLSSDKISPTYNQNGPASREQQFDLGKDSESGKELLDLDNENSGLLGDYLNYIIENANNVFSINPGNEKASTTKRGDSLVIAEEQGAANVFVPQGTEASSKLNENSDSRYFGSAGENLSNIIDKTGKDFDANNLYSDIEGTPLSNFGETLVNQEGEDNKVTKAVNSVLSKNNRFANVGNKTAFSPKGRSSNDFEEGREEIGKITSQRSFGEFSMSDSEITINQLKDVGLSLLYKASGYDQGEQPGQSIDINDLNDQINNEEINSSNISNDGFARVEFRNLRSKYAKGAPEDSAGNSNRDNRGEFLSNEDGSSLSSFGSTFNPTVQFSGKGRKILKIKAAIACLALKKITSDFIDQISNFIKFNDLKEVQETTDEYVSLDKTYSGPGPHSMGTYKQLNSFELDMLKKVVLVRTDYPYPECFEKGIEVFFGEDDEVDKIKNLDHVSQAPGYWLNIASSLLKSFDHLNNEFNRLESFESDSADKLQTLLNLVKSNKLIQFANAAATVGDIFYKTNRGSRSQNKYSNKAFDVDSMPGGPGSRVGKSRDPSSESSLGLSWRQGAVPSMYLLPKNIVKASVDLNNIFDGSSPARGMLASSLVKNTYMDKNHSKSYNRIPNDVVKRLEDRLEGEYVPFYLQDLRTNEIIAFHAFLTNLTDSIKADYTPVSGYGRMDNVQIYKSTSRTVGVTFVLYSTSKEDFNEMWYKINKLTTLLYPQWTQGTQLSSVGADRFVQPFSQVIGASPIVRLRVGDVIKSNYSRFNLARMFGIGDENINPVVGDNKGALEALEKKIKAKAETAKTSLSEFMLDAFYLVMGTPLQYIETSGADRGKTLALTAGRNIVSRALINGFVNPLGAGVVLRKLIDPNKKNVPFVDSSNTLTLAEQVGQDLLGEGEGLGYHAGLRVLIKGNMNQGYKSEDGTIVRFDRPLKALVLGKRKFGKTGNSNNSFVSSKGFKKDQSFDHNAREKIEYKLFIIDPSGPKDIIFTNLFVDHQYIIPDPKDIFMTSSGLLLGIAQPTSFLDYLASFLNSASLALGTGSEMVDLIKNLYATQPEQFMQPENNPFTRAIESTSGRGLAGVIDGFNFNWYNDTFTWETDYNSRAPRGVEISFNLQVIHDLPPGLDHSGYNKAPLYNVGDIMKEISGDARGDDAAAEFEYKRTGNSTYSKTGK